MFLLLNKRFLKKYIFTFLLLLTPLLVLAMRLVSQEESGILRIFLYYEDGTDSADAARQLEEKNGIIIYERVEDEEQARERVRLGEADCLWIFPKDLSEAIQSYLSGTAKSILTVYLREDTVFTMLAREQLFGVLYPTVSFEISRAYLISGSALSDSLGDMTLEEDAEFTARLKELYESNRVTESLLQFSYLDGTVSAGQEEENYLTAPLRGMLALFVFLCGLAVALFYLQDLKNGIFTWMPIRRKNSFPLLYILTGTLDGGAAALLALYLSGSFTTWPKEVILMVLYVLCVAGFCNLLRIFIKSIPSYGACIPVLLLVTTILSPVFFNLRLFPAVQYLLPAYYYLNSLYSVTMTEKMLLYTAVLWAAGLFLEHRSWR